MVIVSERTLDSMRFVVPTFSKADWDTAVADADEEERRLLTAQWRLASLVGPLQSGAAIPERLA